VFARDYLGKGSDGSVHYAGCCQAHVACDRRAGNVDYEPGTLALAAIFMNRTHQWVLASVFRLLRPGETIERIVGFFRQAAKGARERKRKQIIYLLGAGRWWEGKILARRKAEAADGEGAGSKC